MTLSSKIALIALCACLALIACKPKAGEEKDADAAAGSASDLQTDAEKFGYAIGTDIGRSLKPVRSDVDMDALIKGMDEAMSGKPSRLPEAEREKIKSEVSRKLQTKQMEERGAKAKTNKEAGDKFLADNAKREGVKTTASGLQYEILKEGDGPMPKATDKVTVHYKGTLTDGTEFDSSYSRGQPVTFPLGNVIPGWTEGLQLLKQGSKAKLYIPSQLAYGERGAGAKIGPNEALVFEVELLKVEAGAPAEKPGAAAKKK
ncbi:MAG TPA: FKBP-type peptidyl-prolyl cis-trans isomerase [Candidatus Binatia bacterium]|nr:FKBP-type peptidyl-prolyl cis-trans isomerase [Candidatus Binatia bacterium]